MTDELVPAEGISRREMMKRSAIVGGASALVWAAPSVTTFAPRAFGANASPVSDFSNFGILLTCTNPEDPDDVTTYAIQYEVDEGGFVEAGQGQGNILGGCAQGDFLTNWNSATPAPPPDFSKGVLVSIGTNIVITVPDDKPDCIFKADAAVGALKQGDCCYYGTVTDGGKKITFTGPFDNQSPCTGGFLSN
jgi:hypothetical protein